MYLNLVDSPGKQSIGGERERETERQTEGGAKRLTFIAVVARKGLYWPLPVYCAKNEAGYVSCCKGQQTWHCYPIIVSVQPEAWEGPHCTGDFFPQMIGVFESILSCPTLPSLNVDPIQPRQGRERVREWVCENVCVHLCGTCCQLFTECHFLGSPATRKGSRAGMEFGSTLRLRKSLATYKTRCNGRHEHTYMQNLLNQLELHDTIVTVTSCPFWDCTVAKVRCQLLHPGLKWPSPRAHTHTHTQVIRCHLRTGDLNIGNFVPQPLLSGGFLKDVTFMTWEGDKHETAGFPPTIPFAYCMKTKG